MQTTPVSRRNVINPAFRAKIEAIKALLPKDWKQQIAAEFAEYDTLKGGELLRNWYCGRSADPVLTERAEALFGPEKV